MRFERHHSALIVASVITVASFVSATAYTQNRLAALDSVSATIETDAVPSIEYLSRAAVRLTRLNQLLDAVAAGGPQSTGPRAQARRELDALEQDVALYLRLQPLPGEQSFWASLNTTTGRAGQLIRQYLDSDPGHPGASPPNHDLMDDAVDAALASVLSTLDFDIRRSEAMARDLRAVRADTLGMVVKLDAGSSLIALVAAIVAYRASRRHDEVLRERNELLSDRVAELDRFAGRVAHDVLSPLSTIATALPLLRNPSDPRVPDYIDRSESAVRRVRQLVEALLRFARSGAHPDRTARCSVRQVLQAVAADSAGTAEATRVDLRVDIGGDVEVRCAAGVLTSVVQNLVRNAINYMGARPVRHVIVRARAMGEHCRIEVEDTGIGIPAAALGRIFEPFVRGTNQTVAGTGLGLATVKRLVESHGGVISVRSEQDAGTVFTIDLPAAPPM
jgi:signal transduction histidine kinase